MQGLSSPKDDTLEGFRLYSDLEGMSIFPVSQHTGQVDSKVANILGNSSVQSSTECQPRPRQPHASGKRQKSDAVSVLKPSI